MHPVNMDAKVPPPEDTLRRWAAHLDEISEQRVTEPFRDLMADGLIWRDETVEATPSEVISALRLVWHYRTGLIIGEQRRFSDTWQLARGLFPHWVGFRPDRCSPSTELAELYARSQKAK
jgi:hypothetical protein